MKKTLIGCIFASTLLINGCSEDSKLHHKFDNLPPEALAKTINHADVKAGIHIPLGSLSLDDCMAFYDKKSTSKNDALLAKAQHDCPVYMDILHEYLEPQFKDLIMKSDLQTRAFWQQYAASQKIVLRNLRREH